MSDHNTPDGSHPIFYAYAHAFMAVVRASAGLRAANRELVKQAEAEHGPQSPEAFRQRGKDIQSMIEYLAPFDLSQRAFVRAVSDRDIPADAVLERQIPEELAEKIDAELRGQDWNSRPWFEVVEQAFNALAVEHVVSPYNDDLDPDDS